MNGGSMSVVANQCILCYSFISVVLSDAQRELAGGKVRRDVDVFVFIPTGR